MASGTEKPDDILVDNMIVIGIPIKDEHEKVKQLIMSLSDTIADVKNFAVVIIDNQSIFPYTREEFPTLPFDLAIAQNKENTSLYYGFQQLFVTFKIAVLGIATPRFIFKEKNWDIKLKDVFDKRNAGMVAVLPKTESTKVEGCPLFMMRDLVPRFDLNNKDSSKMTWLDFVSQDRKLGFRSDLLSIEMEAV